jgi:hypothetical protein
MDLESTILLNKWWQERFDLKNPKEALRRKRRDGELKVVRKSPSRSSRTRTSGK